MQKSILEPVFKEFFSFWDKIPSADQDYIIRHSSAVTYPQGTHLHNGEECSGVILSLIHIYIIKIRLLRIFHYYSLNRIRYMLARIHAFLQINIYLPPGYNRNSVIAGSMQHTHTGYKELIRFFLKSIYSNYIIVQLLGFPKISKLSYQFFHGLSAAYYNLAPVSYTHLDVYKRQVHALRRHKS